VGHGGALVAPDQGPEAVWAADDSEPRQQRCSDGIWWSEKGISVKMYSSERKKESMGNSRMYLRSKRKHGRARAGAGGRRRAWRPRRSSGSCRDSVARAEEGSGEN
jgi:hypothetical protein